jgi:hypothetical protein
MCMQGLNIGGGGGGTHEIRICLRRHGREREFFAFEHVLGTMLHEITHNHHGPHDAAFYKLLDQYTEVGPGTGTGVMRLARSS